MFNYLNVSILCDLCIKVKFSTIIFKYLNINLYDC